MLFETKHGTGWGQFDLTITTGNKVVKKDDSTEQPLNSGEWMATWRYPAEPDWTPGNYTATVCASSPPPSLSLSLSLSLPPIIQYVHSCILPSLHYYVQPSATENVGASMVQYMTKQRPTLLLLPDLLLLLPVDTLVLSTITSL